MEEIPSNTVGEWERLRAELLADPDNREAYERTLREMVALRTILQQVEEARASAGLSKAQLARRVGMNPAALRRLLTSETGNPTFRTMLSVFDALGLAVTLKRTKSYGKRGCGTTTTAPHRARARKAPPTKHLAS